MSSAMTIEDQGIRNYEMGRLDTALNRIAALELALENVKLWPYWAIVIFGGVGVPSQDRTRHC